MAPIPTAKSEGDLKLHATGHAEPPVSGTRSAPPADPVFDALYEKYFPLVWRTAKRLGVSQSALDDVCQEVFFAVYRQLPTYAGQSSIRTWIFGFIINVVQVHHRSLRRKSPFYRAGGDLIDPDTLIDRDRTAADDSVRLAEAATIAHGALSKMVETKRVPFVMAVLEGFTASEISAVLGLNVNTVHSRLRTARSEFRRLVRAQRTDREQR
jgi:RNA polymerase sigma-70 factor (ECF subfamily)